MRIVFMGTPDFARTVLEALDNEGYEIAAVYTQPDRPKGRSGALVASEVKEYALSKGYTICQPEKIKVTEEVEKLRSFNADAFIVAAYGQFLSEDILNMPKYGCINVHGSLLPKLRGAAPIQRSIINGDSETGVSVMHMDKGMDSGDVYGTVTIPINDFDNEITMYEKLANEGAKLLLELLPKIADGSLKAEKQDPLKVTLAPMLKKEEGIIDWNRSAWEIDCLTRGMCVWPVASTTVGGKGLKIYEALAVKDEAVLSNINVDYKSFMPGTFVVTKKKLFITTGDGLLELVKVQPEGKKQMTGMDFARGQHLETGMCI